MLPELGSTDWQAITLSVQVAMVATLVSLPLGFLAAYLLVFTRLPFKPFWDGIINLPLVLPPVVVGYLLLLLLGRKGPLGSILHNLGIDIIFTWRAAVIASMVVGFPLLVRSIRIGMEQIDLRLVQASRTLGGRWYDTLSCIILPLSGRAMLAGASLMFARSLGEFGATIIIAGNIPGRTQTIPLAIYDYTASPGGEEAALLLCGVSILLALTVLMFNEGLLRRFGQRREP